MNRTAPQKAGPRAPRVPALAIVAIAVLCPNRALGGDRDPLTGWAAAIERSLPDSADQFLPELLPAVAEAAKALDAWVARVGRFEGRTTPDDVLNDLARMLAAHDRISELADQTLALRVGFATLGTDAAARAKVRAFLQVSAALFDLSGRLRYSLSDAITAVLPRLADDPAAQYRLLDMLETYRGSIGATVLVRELASSPISDDNNPIVERILRLAETRGQQTSLGDLARVLKRSDVGPRVALRTAEVIRALGVPQDARPNSDPALPKPAITALDLTNRLTELGSDGLTADERNRRRNLLAWLRDRQERGLDAPRLRVGNIEVAPGDWLLMRNPSPYNLFTDLSPGLFTHVGVVALESGSDGRRRMVVVDLPEQGRSIEATNVEIYLERTLNYVFLRHPDPAIAAAMGNAAAAIIGNPSRFDLNFRTDRVTEIARGPLEGREIHTYCAGLLLLCGLAAEVPRQEVFPFSEQPAGGRTTHNLSGLGLSLGADFVSPSGALFSPRLALVGRREPMYEPGREIEDAVFNHFAEQLVVRDLHVRPDLLQALRLKMAEAAQHSPPLAEALAQASGVGPETDLVGAARAAAVVETLDEIAFGASRRYVIARDLVRGVTMEESRESNDARAAASRLYEQHRELVGAWRQRRITPRQLRLALVKFYIEEGRREIDERFFTAVND